MRYLTDLRHLWDQTNFEPSVERRRQLLTMLSYVLLSLGLFSRQITDFPNVNLRLQNVTWTVLGASILIGLAIFPPVMRYLNKLRSEHSWEHTLTAFSVGFFVDLSNVKFFVPLCQKLFG